MEVTIEPKDDLEVNVMRLNGVGAVPILDRGVILANGIAYRNIVIGPVDIYLFEGDE